ncbi:MAG TPA: hypothetical protein VFS43_23800 [Polyangiaceae bacterium]|nr:hypothetical protein [Polyangiaceae bacterium]
MAPPPRPLAALVFALAASGASTRALAQAPPGPPPPPADEGSLRRRPPPSSDELPPPPPDAGRPGEARASGDEGFDEGGPLRRRERFEPVEEPVRLPRLALWTGGRLGGELPVADGFRDYPDALVEARRFQERQLVGPGPTLEFDVGARLGRRFIPFAFAQVLFASAGSAKALPRPKSPPLSPPGEGTSPPSATSPSVDGSSAFALGLGFRYEFYPEGLSPVVEVAYAFRKTNVRFNTGQALSAESPGELRIGIGASYRVTGALTLSPLLTFAAGSYSDVTLEGSDGRERAVASEAPLHGYLGLSLGAHVDLFGKR